MIELAHFIVGFIGGFIIGISLYPVIFKGEAKK